MIYYSIGKKENGNNGSRSVELGMISRRGRLHQILSSSEIEKLSQLGPRVVYEKKRCEPIVIWEDMNSDDGDIEWRSIESIEHDDSESPAEFSGDFLPN